LIGGEPAEKVHQDRVTEVEKTPSVSVSTPGPVDRIQSADVRHEPNFHAGEKIILAEGPHKDVLGTFLGLDDEVQWAAIKEANGAVSSHPVAWMRSHRGLLSYTSLTGREKT
jgi:transcription antitermination factor NusG